MGEKNPTSFFHVTSTNIGITPKIFLASSFNPFATLVQNFKATPNANPKSLNLNQEHPSEKFWFSGQILIKLRLWQLLS